MAGMLIQSLIFSEGCLSITPNVWLCATPFNNKIVTTYLHGLINGCILKEGSPHLPEKIIL